MVERALGERKNMRAGSRKSGPKGSRAVAVLSVLLLIAIGALAYPTALLALGGIERRELKFLQSMVRERLAKGGTR